MNNDFSSAELNPSSLQNMAKRMWPMLKPYWFRALLGLSLTIPVGALDGAVAMFLRYYVDNVVVSKSASWASYIPYLIVIFAIVQGVLNYASAYFNLWVGTKMTTNLKKRLYSKLLTFDPGFFDTHNSGEIVYRFYSDADTASTTMVNNVRLFLTRTFSSIGLVFVLLYNSWVLTILAVAVLGLLILPMQNVRRRIKKITPKIVTSGSEVITSYNETCGGFKTITAYNLQGYQQQKQDGILDKLFSLTMKMVKHTNWLSPLMHIVVALGLAAVIWVSNGLLIDGKLQITKNFTLYHSITSGNFAAFIAALLMLYTPLKAVGNNYIEIQKALLALERVFQALGFEPTIKQAAKPVTIEGVKRDITFENVTFEYRENVPVLKNISIKIPVGTTTALVGNSGGGKTTFVNIIPRFYDIKGGSVKIDGVDLRDLDLASLRNQIAIVFQDNFLFSGSIRENILLGKPEASEGELISAIKGAHLEDFIKTLKNGLDTYVGERGVTLSGGQKQRVAIARALLKDAPIVILDEATSALDNRSEAIVQKAIDNLMKDRTVFVIAHRLSTVQHADRIVVLNEGNIAETGTHEELLENGAGAYKALYNAQFKEKKKSAKKNAAEAPAQEGEKLPLFEVKDEKKA